MSEFWRGVRIAGGALAVAAVVAGAVLLFNGCNAIGEAQCNKLVAVTAPYDADARWQAGERRCGWVDAQGKWHPIRDNPKVEVLPSGTVELR